MSGGGSFESLIYDTGAYCTDLKQSTAPIKRMLDPTYANNCSACRPADIGYSGKIGASVTHETPLIDVDSHHLYLPVIKKKFKKYYNQVQIQIYCSDLQSCNLVFLIVNIYDDDENRARIITDSDVAKFRIERDDKAIESIKQRGAFFQSIKDQFKP